MIDVKALRQAWSYDRVDVLALLGTGVVAFGFEEGIALGIGLSLSTLLYRASTPHIAVIGRIDESLFFGNLNPIEARLAAELEKSPDIHDVVLVMSAVNYVDATAMEVLTDLNNDLLARKIRLHLAEVKGPVQDRLADTPLWRGLSGTVHLSANGAFETLRRAPADA